jgi:hypothetical protein
MVMRRAAGPSYNFFARIDPESEERRRRLQDRLNLSGGELVAAALRSLEADLDPTRQSSAAA